MADLRIRIDGCRPAFLPRARWVLETFAQCLDLTAVFVDLDGAAELTYGPTAPTQGVWIQSQDEAQRFFEAAEPFPGPHVYKAAGLTLLFAPSSPGPMPGDIVASAFYLLARWDERHVRKRDQFDRLPLAASAFGNIGGLDLETPPVEGYLDALRAALRLRPPVRWQIALTHDIDRLRRYTLKGTAGVVRRQGPRALVAAARSTLGRDPWDNIPNLLQTSWQRGVAPTVYFIGRNAHPLDGTPRDDYERRRAQLARAVLAAGGEVGLHAAFASSESGEALAEEFALLRGEVGPSVVGVRFHYLRFRYHETVRWLEAAGATYDTSLGFSEAPGFAAGIARPFRPYLIGEERPANLHLLPLAVMDTTLHSHLGLDADAARERALTVLDRVRAHGGRVALLWHNTYLADDRAPGYGALWGDLLDELQARGAELGPAWSAPDEAERVDQPLKGKRVVHLTSVHRPRDVRIFHKEVRSLHDAGAEASVLALAKPERRLRRLAAGWRLVQEAKRRGADVYHVHDPELLPAALWLAQTSGTPVIYDAHEYLGQTTRTKRWLPRPLRLPLAVVVERLEQAAARRLSGTVTANEDLAARFAASGSRAISVSNGPRADGFPEPEEPNGLGVLYVGGLGPLRGLPLMKEAFPLVGVVGAHLQLAGPGDPGTLPSGVEHLGAVDHSEVPSLLAAARIAWIPLQRTGNYDRAVPTKLVEAMAAGRPVVASDLPLMASIVRRTGCGLVVSADDPHAHADALRRLLTEPGLAARMGAAGRRAFLDGLSFEVQAAKLVGLYEEILS